MPAIFISYRREDAEGQAGRLSDDLVSHFGEGSVFMDVTGIEQGRDFREAIKEHVASCDVLLAMIGKDWLGVKDESGRRRLEDPLDFVRLEIASALKRDIPVIPVLVGRAIMPRSDQLPPDLANLPYRNGVELTHARWDSDVQVLIKALRPHVEATNPATRGLGEAGTEGTVPPSPEPGVDGKKSLRRIVATSVVAIAIGLGVYLLYGKITDEKPEAGKSPTPLQEASLFEPPASFASYQIHLQGLGYNSKTGLVGVLVYPEVAGYAHYDQVRNSIVVGKAFAGDVDVIFREYTHHALMSVVNGNFSHPVLSAIESSLADYFPCSFNNDAIVGEESAPELRRLSGGRFDKPYVRNLENSRNFGEITMRSSPQDAGEVWGGAFWEMRGLLKRERADKLLFSTWVALQPSDTLNNPASSFVGKLLEISRALEGGVHTERIRGVFGRRGLKL